MKKNEGVYTFLESSGVFDKGTDAEIKESRKKYWRMYKCNWRKNKRKEEKEITTSYTKDELTELNKASKKYGINRTSFIKQATFAYINKTYIVPHKFEIRCVKQLLAMNYNSIEAMREQNILLPQMAQIILQKLTELEKEILVNLHNPKTLHSYIAEVITTQPDQKTILFELLQKS